MGLQENLVQLRREQHLSQEDLAERLGVTRQTISRWEVGTVIPTADNLLALGTLYGVSAEELMDGDIKDILRAAESAAKAEPLEPETRHKPKKRFWLTVMGVIIIYLLIFLWGEVTRSRTSAAALMEMLGYGVLASAAVWGLCKFVLFFFNRHSTQ